MRHALPSTLFALCLVCACTAPEDVPSNEPDATAQDRAFKTAGAPADAIKVAKPTSWQTAQDRVPKSIHMTWQRDPATTITFQWTTDSADLKGYQPLAWVVPAAAADAPEAEGRMPWAKEWVTKGTGAAYETELLGIVIFEGEQPIWTVEVVGLKPATEYVYRLGSWQDFEVKTGQFKGPTLSPPQRFRTPPAKGSRAPMHVIMAGDSRDGTDMIRKEMSHLAKHEAAVWFFNGDMCPGGLQDQWDDWFDAMAPVLHNKVLMPVQGNHELYANVYYAQFALPKAKALGPDWIEHGWSLDINNVHFVGLDSNTEKSVQAMVAWLDADLGKARADPDIDWIIVMSHHPMYSAGNHGSTGRMQTHWATILDKHDVRLAFSGHDHSYERTWPIRNGAKAKDEKGVTYVVAGGFFAPAYSAGKEWWTATSTSGDVYNWVDVKVEGTTIELTAWSGDGKTKLDSVMLKR